jgi:hypothetical protein
MITDLTLARTHKGKEYQSFPSFLVKVVEAHTNM